MVAARLPWERSTAEIHLSCPNYAPGPAGTVSRGQFSPKRRLRPALPGAVTWIAFPPQAKATLRLQQASELIVTGTAGAAIFLSTLDSGIINVALPSFQAQFHVDVSTISLAITLYMSVIGTTIVLFGRLADRFGRTAILSAGFALFGLALSALRMFGFGPGA